MQKRMLVLALLAPLVLTAYLTPKDEEYLKGLSLLNFVEKSDVIVIGTVVNKQYVSRPGLTNDITIRADTMVKGQPNLGDNHVIFMIEGGKGYNAAHGEVVVLEVVGQPEFKIGEEVMVFLSKQLDSSRYHAKYPYDHLHVIRQMHGKRHIKDGKLQFAYLNADSKTDYIKFPVSLAKNLALAYAKDKDDALALETQIKTLVLSGTTVLPDSLIDTLTTSSQNIIDREENE